MIQSIDRVVWFGGLGHNHVTKDTKNTLLKNITSIIKNYLKDNLYHNKLFILTYKISNYYNT